MLAERLYECSRTNLQVMLGLKNESNKSLEAVHKALFSSVRSGRRAIAESNSIAS